MPNPDNQNSLGEGVEEVRLQWGSPQQAAEVCVQDLALPQNPRDCPHQIPERMDLKIVGPPTSSSAFDTPDPFELYFIDKPSSVPPSVFLASCLGMPFLLLTPSHGWDSS